LRYGYSKRFRRQPESLPTGPGRYKCRRHRAIIDLPHEPGSERSGGYDGDRALEPKTMDTTFKDLTNYLLALGTSDVEHSGKGFLAHLIGVYQDLKVWGCDEAVCRAGLFHSIYGTEMFQGFALPVEKRPEVVELIGERAERLAYINSAMNRDSFDGLLAGSRGPRTIIDRMTGASIKMTQREFDDLCLVHLCDWLEQAPRSQNWEYRPVAYQQIAERLGGVALDSYRKVYAKQAVGSPA